MKQFLVLFVDKKLNKKAKLNYIKMSKKFKKNSHKNKIFNKKPMCLINKNGIKKVQKLMKFLNIQNMFGKTMKKLLFLLNG